MREVVRCFREHAENQIFEKENIIYVAGKNSSRFQNFPIYYKQDRSFPFWGSLHQQSILNPSKKSFQKGVANTFFKYTLCANVNMCLLDGHLESNEIYVWDGLSSSQRISCWPQLANFFGPDKIFATIVKKLAGLSILCRICARTRRSAQNILV